MRTTRVLVAALAIGSVVLTGCGETKPTTITKTVTVKPSAPTAKTVTKMYDAGSSEPYDGMITFGDGGIVATPEGTWHFGLGKVASSVDGETMSYLTEGKNVLVPVAWSFTPPGGYSQAEQAGAVSQPDQTEIRLVAGGKPYLLTPDMTSSDAQIVAVPGAANQPLSLRVTYRDLTQTIDLRTGKVTGTERAAGLYDGLSTSGSGTCPEISNGFTSGVGLQVRATCGIVAVTRASYRKGSGWAPAGTAWVTATVIVNPGSFVWHNPDKTVSIYSTKVELTGASLGGKPSSSISRTGNSFNITFAAPAGKASMQLVLNQKLTGITTQVAPPQTAAVAPEPTSTSTSPTSTAAPSDPSSSPSDPSAPRSTTSSTVPSPSSTKTLPGVNAPQTVTLTQNVVSTISFRKA